MRQCRTLRRLKAMQRVSICYVIVGAAVQTDCRPSQVQTAREALTDSKAVKALIQRFENGFRPRLEPARAGDSRLAGMLSLMCAARSVGDRGSGEASTKSSAATKSGPISGTGFGRNGKTSWILPAETSSIIFASPRVLRRVIASTTAPKVAGAFASNSMNSLIFP
jgi:hypothetical protein